MKLTRNRRWLRNLRGRPREQVRGVLEVAETLEKLKTTLAALEKRLRGREYLAGEFSLANIAYAGNFVRLREISEKSEIGLAEYPNVMAWMERVEARESFKAAG